MSEIRTEVTNIMEVRRSLRAIKRCFAEIQAAIAGVATFTVKDGGVASAIRGKILATDRFGEWNELAPGDDALSLMADASQQLGVRWAVPPPAVIVFFALGSNDDF